MDTPQVSEEVIEAIMADYPTLPSEYFAYLREAGWGLTANGRLIYSGPIEPDEVYGGDVDLGRIVLLGDDMQGNCLGYDLDTGVIGEVDPDGKWQAWSPGTKFTDYIEG